MIPKSMAFFQYSGPYDDLNPKPTLVDCWMDMEATEIFLLLVRDKGIILFGQAVFNLTLETNYLI